MRLARLVASLVISGLALLVVGIALSFTPARAANSTAARDYGRNYDTSAYRYTDKPAPAAAAGSRTLTIYVDRDFDPAERERIGLALQQWNHVLNGFVRLRPALLPPDPSDQTGRSSADPAPGSWPRSTAAIPPRASARRSP